MKFTKEFMLKNRGCYTLSELTSCSFWPIDESEIELLSIINSEIPLKYKFWFVCKNVATMEQNIKIAKRCANIAADAAWADYAAADYVAAAAFAAAAADAATYAAHVAGEQLLKILIDFCNEVENQNQTL